ncbi:MAG TPA: N-acetyltransferase [Caulobacteraceae bacterium]|nr:N-acetyltransferase [Caulobacteraceae bacterium]
MIIRAAAPEDHASIAAVVEAAFGRPDEARIVDGVRAEGAELVELVAEDAGEIIGHVLFSRMSVSPPHFVAALGPLAVAPRRQNRGAGTALCRAGIGACRELGAEVVVVLGHPAYYPRFGFSHAAAAKLASPYAARSAFMALALTDGALDEPLKVGYPAAFG